MKSFLDKFRSALAVVGKVELYMGCLFLLGILLCITVQVVMRSLFNEPIAWTDELAVYAFVWLTFTGTSIAFKLMRHITIQSFVSAFPAKLQSIFRVIIYCLIFALAAVLYKEIGRTMQMENMSTTVALPIKLPRSWFFSLPLRICMLMTVITAFYYSLAGIYGTFTGTKLEPIMDSHFIEEEEIEL
ncbi:MAG: TRAP transporter small permease [Spirochaetales bacterium]|nr:TRAP transporter small permease [Spirochaetales bacterium]